MQVVECAVAVVAAHHVTDIDERRVLSVLVYQLYAAQALAPQQTFLGLTVEPLQE